MIYIDKHSRDADIKRTSRRRRRARLLIYVGGLIYSYLSTDKGER